MPEGRAGHEKNWLDAIRQKGQAVSNFDYAGPFTESRAARQRALRFPGQRLLWDAPSMKVTNMPEADQFIQHQYRKAGWSLTGLADGSTAIGTTSTERMAGSGSSGRASATCGASRTRR